MGALYLRCCFGLDGPVKQNPTDARKRYREPKVSHAQAKFKVQAAIEGRGLLDWLNESFCSVGTVKVNQPRQDKTNYRYTDVDGAAGVW
eukprot:gene6766-4856_t